MYATCLFCHASLGRNEVVEPFPVGRRLAFDEAKGRLWVVCTGCGRWNLSPLEERWEAIEECERRFRATQVRVSTDHIGLARLRDGLELVRIGPALRPEYAAWRYGGELMRRRRRDQRAVIATVGGAGLTMLGSTAAVSAGLAVAAIGLAAPVVAVGGALAYYVRQDRRVVARVPAAATAPALVRRRDLARLAFVPEHADGLALRVPSSQGAVHVAGDLAARLAAVACAARNAMGADARSVQTALALLDDAGGPDGMLQATTRDGALGALRYSTRLALEMALHDETERRAMEGELAALADAWREAEEIAAIADDLLLPPTVRERLGRGTHPDHPEDAR